MILPGLEGQVGSLNIINGRIIQIEISNILWNISPVIFTTAELTDKQEINNALIDQNTISVLGVKINSSSDCSVDSGAGGVRHS